MIHNFLSFVTIAFLSLSSCKSEKRYVKTEYFLNDEYKSEISYKGSLKDGIARNYYEDESLKRQFAYKEDTLNGAFIEFDKNHNIEFQGYFWKGKAVGASNYYTNNRLTLYNERDYEGDVYYVKKYDLDGNVVKEEGKAISPNLYANIIGDTITVNKEILLWYFYSEPEGYTNILKATLNGNPITCTILPGHICQITKLLIQPGVYHFKVESSLKRQNQILVIDNVEKIITCL